MPEQSLVWKEKLKQQAQQIEIQFFTNKNILKPNSIKSIFDATVAVASE